MCYRPPSFNSRAFRYHSISFPFSFSSSLMLCDHNLWAHINFLMALVLAKLKWWWRTCLHAADLVLIQRNENQKKNYEQMRIEELAKWGTFRKTEANANLPLSHHRKVVIKVWKSYTSHMKIKTIKWWLIYY